MKKHIRNSIVLFVSLLFVLPALAQRVYTVEVYSPKMKKNIKNVIILPESYDKSKDARFPVLYLLNGYSGRYDSWIGIKSTLPQEASRWNMIVVCPDGQNSWYWDSPVDSASQFDTYVSGELVAHMDKNYRTKASPKGRAITGLSMGGHGGLWLGINHQEVFGACGSMSGGVDIRPFPNNWEMKRWLGEYNKNKELWDSRTVINQLHKIEPNKLAIIIDCGTSDFFYEVNQKLHEDLLYRNIQHDYITRPGAHNGEYWNNAIDYQMLFFSKFFQR